jgi:hypothetical protein
MLKYGIISTEKIITGGEPEAEFIARYGNFTESVKVPHSEDGHKIVLEKILEKYTLLFYQDFTVELRDNLSANERFLWAV